MERIEANDNAMRQIIADELALKIESLERRYAELVETVCRRTDQNAKNRIEVARLTIPGHPVGKQRVRVVRSRAGFPVAYTPAKTKNYETLVRELFIIKYPAFTPLDEPVEIDMEISIAIPKSASKKRQRQMEAGLIWPTTRPDMSNVVKAVEDALNGVAYRDDSLIVRGVTEKKYSWTPRVEITIYRKGENGNG